MFSSENNFTKSVNIQKVDQAVIDFGEIICLQETKPVVLSSDNFSTTLRQVYLNLELIYSRHQYLLDLFLYRNNKKEFEERLLLMNFINGNAIDYSGINELLDKYSVDYIINNEDDSITNFLLENGWSILDKKNEYRLFIKTE